MTPFPFPALKPSAVLAFVALSTLAIVSSFAAPNLTDLQSFRGQVRGTGKVATGSGSFFGKSKMRVSIKAATAIKIKILASIKSGGRAVPINNELTFLSSGVVRGKELVPGITSGVPFKGTYTATPNHISFSGTFKAQSVTGSFSGTATKSSNGKLKVIQSIFVGENPNPSYIYTYTGK